MHESHYTVAPRIEKAFQEKGLDARDAFGGEVCARLLRMHRNMVWDILRAHGIDVSVVLDSKERDTMTDPTETFDRMIAVCSVLDQACGEPNPLPPGFFDPTKSVVMGLRGDDRPLFSTVLHD